MTTLTLHYTERSDIFQLAVVDPAEPIADMTPRRRLHCAAKLIAEAPTRKIGYLGFLRWDNRPCPFIVNAPLWMAGTPLVLALAAGLPAKRNPLAALAERARHQAACPVQPCNCDVLLDPVDREVLALVAGAVLAARAVAR